MISVPAPEPPTHHSVLLIQIAPTPVTVAVPTPVARFPRVTRLLKPGTFNSAPLVMLSVPVPWLPTMSVIALKSDPVTMKAPVLTFNVPVELAASPIVAATPRKATRPRPLGLAGLTLSTAVSPDNTPIMMPRSASVVVPLTTAYVAGPRSTRLDPENVTVSTRTLNWLVVYAARDSMGKFP